MPSCLLLIALLALVGCAAEAPISGTPLTVVDQMREDGKDAFRELRYRESARILEQLLIAAPQDPDGRPLYHRVMWILGDRKAVYVGLGFLRHTISCSRGVVTNFGTVNDMIAESQQLLERGEREKAERLVRDALSAYRWWPRHTSPGTWAAGNEVMNSIWPPSREWVPPAD